MNPDLAIDANFDELHPLWGMAYYQYGSITLGFTEKWAVLREPGEDAGTLL